MNDHLTLNPLNHIQQFHQEVEQLFLEFPPSFLGFIYRKWMNWTFLASNGSVYTQQIRNLFHHANKKADFIIKQLPENIRDLTALRRTLLEEIHLGTHSKSRLEFSHRELLTFCEDIDRLFGQIFPKIENLYSQKDKMSVAIQNFLSPELKQLRLEKQQNLFKIIDDEHRTQRKMAKGKLAVGLGHGIKTNKGSTGTLIICDINSKAVGVHKVSEKDVPWLIRIKNLLKSIFGGQLTYLSKKSLAQPRSERAAFLLSSQLGFDLAPCSVETTIKNKMGVFQIFVNQEKRQSQIFAIPKDKINEKFQVAKYPHGKGPNDYVEVRQVIDQIDLKTSYSLEEKTKFQLFAIFDYVIGNLDRHEENWFVTISPNFEITHIKAIDNAYAFPKKQPKKGSMATSNQYKWQSRVIAKQEFTEEAKKFVKEHLTKEKITTFIKNLKLDLPDFLDSDMEQLLIQRTHVAYLLTQKDFQTPASLAACSSEEDINDYLNKYNRLPA